MIALPGLTLLSGARKLREKSCCLFAVCGCRNVAQQFPGFSGAPQYNTVDAALWYFEAVRQYYAATQDLELVQQLFPTLVEIVDRARARHALQTSRSIPRRAHFRGRPEVQLTWMDAKSETGW